MSVKRIVDTRFWDDEKVIEKFSPEDKLFMLYLLTNPHTTQLGIYSINKKHMAFELGYSLETINILLERFTNEYKMIIYSEETREIGVKNYLKYSIIKGGKPVEDCIKKEISLVKNKKIIKFIFNNIGKYENINQTIKNIINEYDNDNDNDNERYEDVSYNESSTPTIFEYLESNFGYSISPIIVEKINGWLEYFNEDIMKYAIDKCCMANVRQFNYLEGILKNWKSKGYKTINDCKNENNKKNDKLPEWFDKEQEETKATDEQRKEMEDLLKEFR